MSQYFKWTYFGIIFSLCSCAHVAEKPRAKPRDIARLQANIEARSIASGSGAVTLKTPRRSVSASGILVVDWPRGLRLEVQNPLGGTVAFLVMDETEFWSYTEEEGVAWRGKVNAPHSRRFLPLPLAPQDFFRALLARPALDEASLGPKDHTLVLQRNGRRETISWDPVNDQVLRWRLEGEEGAYVDAEYGDYFLKSGQAFPRKVRLSYFQKGSEKFRLSWHWHDLETYLPAISNPFSIPPSWAREIATKNAAEARE